MTNPPVIDALRRLAGPGPAEVSDAELLARFVQHRDGAAFEALVRRHSGIVWGACRRRLRDSHAAEDAFQTTFLALARHAATVRRPDALGAWLHRVAVRCSAAFRRPARETMSAPLPDLPAPGPDPAAAAVGRDLERLIDSEVDALPEPYRLAFVLCEIEQRSAAEAARVLGCAVGTVESRLTRARIKLRQRLTRRGIVAGTLLGLGLAAGPVPTAVAAAAIALGMAAMRVPGTWALIADRAARHGSAALGVALVGGMALALGAGVILWGVPPTSDRPGPVVFQQPPGADLPVPDPDRFRRNRQNFPLPPEAIARVGDPWLRHGTVPHKLSFSGDGQFLAAAGAGDRWLRVWDLNNSRPRMHLPLAAGEVPVAVALSDDGNTLRAVVHAGEAREAQLRDYDTFRGEETRRRKVTAGPVESAAFTLDGKHLAIVREGRVRLHGTDTAAELWRADSPPGTGRIDLAFSVTGGRLAVVVAGTAQVRLLDLASGRAEGADLIDAGAALSLPTFSADGGRLATWCAERQRIQIWDVGNRRLIHTIKPGYPLSGLTFLPNGEEVVGLGSGRCPIQWPAQAGGRPRMFVDGCGGMAAVFTPDGAVLAVATPAGAVQLFDPKTGRGHRASPVDVFTPVPTRFSPDGQRLLVEGFQSWRDYSMSGDQAPWTFVPGGRPNEPYLTSAGERTAVSPDRSLIARCTFERQDDWQEAGIDLLDAATGTPTVRILPKQMARRPAFSPDGRTLYAVCADRKIHGWDVRTGKEVMCSQRSAGELVSRVRVSPDGRYLATAVLVLTEAQRANSIQVWDATSGEPILSAEAGRGRPHIAFSPDGRRFAAAVAAGNTRECAPEMHVWDLATRKVLVTAPGYHGQPAFSPDGRTLAVTRDDAVVLLELATGQARHQYRHHGPVEPAVVWRPDGRVLASASPEAPVYLWDVVGDRSGTVPAWDVAKDDRRWAALSGSEAAPAFAVVRQLWAHPADAVPFLKARITPSADALLATRACEVLELIASADATAVLTTWSNGSGPLASEARDSLKRLKN